MEKQPFLADDAHEPRRQAARRSSPWIVCALVASIVLNVGALYRVLTWSPLADLDQTCGEYIEQHDSPLLDAVPVSYETVRYNGSLLKENIYRGAPSAETDAAWDDLGVNFGVIVIPEDNLDDIARFGLDPGMVKRKPSQGGGFVVEAEGLHHLHCLNLVRQAVWFNYDYYKAQGGGPFKNEDNILRKHVGHCIDILRQQLMCTFDTSVFGQWWVKDVGPFVDFNTDHRCKNFADYRDWFGQRALGAHGGLVKFRDGDVLLPEIP